MPIMPLYWEWQNLKYGISFMMDLPPPPRTCLWMKWWVLSWRPARLPSLPWLPWTVPIQALTAILNWPKSISEWERILGYWSPDTIWRTWQNYYNKPKGPEWMSILMVKCCRPIITPPLKNILISRGIMVVPGGIRMKILSLSMDPSSWPPTALSP